MAGDLNTVIVARLECCLLHQQVVDLDPGFGFTPSQRPVQQQPIDVIFPLSQINKQK